MTDMDLLKLAAKAAGFDYITTGDEEIMYAWEGREPTKWNPLVDDGDALRLAVKLNLQIAPATYHPDEAYVFHVGIGEIRERVNYLQDLYAATRRAIVLAAAEIGKRGS